MYIKYLFIKVINRVGIMLGGFIKRWNVIRFIEIGINIIKVKGIYFFKISKSLVVILVKLIKVII